MDWEKFKYKFADFIENNKISKFNDFYKSLIAMSNEEKGNYFEYLCKLYFKLETINKDKYKEIYLYTEIKPNLKKKLNLPTKDKGIDAIVIDNDDNIFAIQCKFRTNYNKTIPFGELSTFPALTFGSDVKIDGGIFFSNCSDICDELKNNKYTHTLFNALDDKCNELFWKNVKEYIREKPLTKYKLKTPKNHQQDIIFNGKQHFMKEKNGRLYLACGTGKTFISYWLSTKELGYTKIFIVVPSLYLLSQTYETWMMETQYEKDKFHFILIGSDMDNKEELLCEYKPTTDKNKIKEELEEFDKVVVIMTYHSSELLIDVCKKLDYKFDMGIFDEAHRTVGEEDKCFTKIMSSEISEKRLFMTATEKIYNINRSKKSDEERETILSMDNEKVYGKVIHRYSMRQAIEDGVLVDYRIIAPFINSKKYTEKLLNNQFVNEEDIMFDTRIILTGLMIISSMEEFKFKHLLIFSNTNGRARKIMEFIELYLSKSEHPLKDILNCKYLSGNDSMNKRKGEVKEFEGCEYGIISSARIFGEGIDIKICDAICFADGKSSSVDIVQYVGRCLRKCDLIPDKLSYVLVPFVLDEDSEFFDYENQSYVKLRKILKTIGTTDEMVTEKFILMDCNERNYKSVDKSESNVKYENNGKIDIKEFTKNILSKVFDKTGDAIDRTRNILIFENKRRYENKEELIDTRKKCMQFLKSKNIKEEPFVKNWIKYSLGEKLFEIIKNNYYYSKDTIINACKKIGITNYDTYKIKFNKDKYLPSYVYIDDGFYYDMDVKFNIEKLLSVEQQDEDY